MSTFSFLSLNLCVSSPKLLFSQYPCQMGTWTCVLSLIVYRLSLSLSLCLSLPLSLSLSLLLKVENYISLKLSMFGLELLPIKLVEPMNLLGCYVTFTTICKPVCKWKMLKIVTFGLCSTLENKMSIWHLIENR